MRSFGGEETQFRTWEHFRGDDGSDAKAVNDQVQIVGCSGGSDYPVQNPHAFIWTKATGMVDLNEVVDSSGSGWVLQCANDINNFGLIVGYGTYNGQQRAFLATPID